MAIMVLESSLCIITPSAQITLALLGAMNSDQSSTLRNKRCTRHVTRGPKLDNWIFQLPRKGGGSDRSGVSSGNCGGATVLYGMAPAQHLPKRLSSSLEATYASTNAKD